MSETAESPELLSLRKTLETRKADLERRKGWQLPEDEAKQNREVIAREERDIREIEARIAVITTPVEPSAPVEPAMTVPVRKPAPSKV